MRINATQLTKKLSENLAPLYIVTGEDTAATVTAIIAAAEKRNFKHTQRLEAADDPGEKLLSICFNYSLLAEPIIMIARLNAAKPENHTWLTIIARFAQQPSVDKILIVLLEKLTTAQYNATWFKKLTACGLWVHSPPLSATQFNQWLKEILTEQRYELTAAAWQLLIDHLANNILAARQIVQKLSLLFPQKGKLTETDMVKVIIPANYYTVFDLINAITAKKAKKTIDLLTALQAEQIEPAIILWALARECRQRQQHDALTLLFTADQIIKGLQPGCTWTALMQLSLKMANS